jgi:hypothetical protein
MPVATLGSMDVRALVPRELGPPVAERMRRAVAGPLPDALAEAFGVLDTVDPGAYWVLRELTVELTVPASEPDSDRQARRIADALAVAVGQVVQRGPSSDAVRFPGRPEYAAAYVRARLSGSGTGWLFERLAAFDALPATDALLAAARAIEADLVDAIAALTREDGGWQRLVDTATPAAASRLAAAVGRLADGVAVAPELGARVAAARSERHLAAGGPDVIRDHARENLRLLGDLARASALTPGLVAAVWRAPAEPATAAAAPGPAAEEPTVADRTREEPGSFVAAGRAAQPVLEPVGRARSFASPGAVAFMLLPDLDELLADQPLLAADHPAAAAVRAEVLAGVLGPAIPPGDPAVALAAGVATDPDPAEFRDLCVGPVAAWTELLAGDPVLGFAPEADAGCFDTAAFPVASAALVRAFARHLIGFGRASARHLVPRVLPPGGRVTVSEELIEAVVPAAQLQVLLALGGLDAFACRPRWLVARVLVSHEVMS